MKKYFELNHCCFCGKPFIGDGYNPHPVTDEGICCPECNKLTMQRKLMMLRQRKGERKNVNIQ